MEEDEREDRVRMRERAEWSRRYGTMGLKRHGGSGLRGEVKVENAQEGWEEILRPVVGRRTVERSTKMFWEMRAESYQFF